MQANRKSKTDDFRVIAFDCDGVLFDTTASNRAYYNAIRHHLGMPDMTDDEFDYVHMHTVKEALVHLFGKGKRLLAAQTFRKRLSYRPFLHAMEMEPRLKPLLQKLRPTYHTAIASNRTDTMGEVLLAHNLEPFFDYVVTAGDVLNPKPHPEPLLKIIDHFAVEPGQVLYVGDSELDEIAAKKAAMPFVAYKNPSLSADYHIESLGEIESILAL